MRQFSRQSIRLLRKKLRFTQRDLAERLSVSSLTIHRWETGQSSPDADQIAWILQLADAYQVSVDLFPRVTVSRESADIQQMKEELSVLQSKIRQWESADLLNQDDNTLVGKSHRKRRLRLHVSGVQSTTTNSALSIPPGAKDLFAFEQSPTGGVLKLVELQRDSNRTRQYKQSSRGGLAREGSSSRGNYFVSVSGLDPVSGEAEVIKIVADGVVTGSSEARNATCDWPASRKKLVPGRA